MNKELKAAVRGMRSKDLDELIAVALAEKQRRVNASLFGSRKNLKLVPCTPENIANDN